MSFFSAGDVVAQILAALLAFIAAFLPAHTLSYYAPRPEPEKSAKILFGGDMMFDRNIRLAAKEQGNDFIFSCIDSVLAGADVVVANLEGPITDRRSTSVGSAPGDAHNYTFTFPTSTAAALFSHNIRIVSIGNNHIMNLGREGLLQTKQWLERAGVQYFGDPDAVEADRVLRTEVGGIQFSFVNWSDWTSDKTDHTIAQVRAEAESGRVVVVYTHWGNEYVPPPARVRELAHEFVKAGAAIIVGSHPHIVQEHEVYTDPTSLTASGKYIYYSLGNFIFDQYFDEQVRNGLLLEVTFSPKGVASITELPIELSRENIVCPERGA